MPPEITGVARPTTRLPDITQPTLRCAHCHLRGRCLASSLPLDELGEMREASPGHRRVSRGQALYQAGGPFRSIYAIRLGFFKSYALTEDGRSQVVGFPMPGDILAMDGIDTVT
jgi:CRP/FNR family transcriptional regulator